MSILIATLASDGAAATRHALLIGVSDYEMSGSGSLLQDLDGPRNDVLLMQRTLRELWGPNAKITVLADSLEKADYIATGIAVRNPTKENILSALRNLATEVSPGDEVLIHYSGHGTQLPVLDPQTAAESDGFDEVILPIDAFLGRGADGQLQVKNHIRDNTFGAAIAAIQSRGAFVWVVIDACYSGTFLRAEPARDRRVRYAGLNREVMRNVVDMDALEANGSASDEGFGDSSGRDDLSGDVVAFYAAHPDTVTAETPFPSGEDTAGARQHGVLTWHLAQALMRGAGATYRTLTQKVRNGMWTYGLHPTFEGALDAIPMVPADGVPHYGLSRQDGELVVAAGLLHGIGQNSVLDVHYVHDPETAAFSVRVTEPALEFSRVEILRNDPDFPNRLTELAEQEALPLDIFLGEDRLGAFTSKLNTLIVTFEMQVRLVEAAPHPTAEETRVGALLSQVFLDTNNWTNSGVRAVTDPDAADLELLVRKGRLFFTAPGHRPIETGPYRDPSLELDALTAEILGATLKQMARARNVHAIASLLSDTDIMENLATRLAIVPGAFSAKSSSCNLLRPSRRRRIGPTLSTSITAEKVPAAAMSLHMCSTVFVELTNLGGVPIDIEPFYLDRHGKIQSLKGYLTGLKGTGGRYLLKLQPGETSLIVFAETVPALSAESQRNLDWALFGPMQLVLFLVQGEPGQPYSPPRFRWLDGENVASHPGRGARADIIDLYGLLASAGWGENAHGRARMTKIQNKTGAMIIPFNILPPLDYVANE